MSQLTVNSLIPSNTYGWLLLSKKIEICWTICVCLWLQDQAKGNVKNNLHFSNQCFFWVFYNDAKSWKNRLKMISEGFMSVVYIRRALLEKHFMFSKEGICKQKVLIQGKSKRKSWGVRVGTDTIHLPKQCLTHRFCTCGIIKQLKFTALVGDESNLTFRDYRCVLCSALPLFFFTFSPPLLPWPQRSVVGSQYMSVIECMVV